MKKFRKDRWDDDEDYSPQKSRPKNKKFDRALRTKDIDYLSTHYDEDDLD